MLGKCHSKRYRKILFYITTFGSAVINRWKVSASEKEICRRFFHNTGYEVADILSKSHASMIELEGQHILSIGDTTSFNYSGHNGLFRTSDKNIGLIEDNKSTGLRCHVTLGVNSATGLPVGISDIHFFFNSIFGKTGKGQQERRETPIEEKQSNRWLEGARRSCEEVFQTAKQQTVIYDREADIFELFARIPRLGLDLLVRCSWNRLLESGELMEDYLCKQPVMHYTDLAITGNNNRSARTAQMAIKWTEVQIQKPLNRRTALKNDLDSISLWVVDVQELAQSVPAHEAPIHWRLLTTHKVSNIETAKQIVLWYSYRWWIEELFRLLKTEGFHIENSQLEKGDALQKLIAINILAALKVLTLRQARYCDETSTDATLCFNQEEIELLEISNPKLEGKTDKQKNPHKKQSLKWAVWIIARIAGWTPHSKDIYARPPGIITLKKGLDIFYFRLETYKQMKDIYQKSDRSP